MSVYVDEVFAPVDRDHNLERIAGGNETEVYRTDDGRFVVKLKHDLGCDAEAAVACACEMRDAAEQYTDCLGPRYTIPNHYVVSRDSAGRVQVLVIQPCLADAHQLHDLDYGALQSDERAAIARQLRDIIRRSLVFYRTNGNMPDLYGRSSRSRAERVRTNGPLMLPSRLWSFLVKRNLLRSHNLMLTGAPEPRVVLVDYDFVRRSRMYRLIYYTVRWMLFWRDHTLIELLRRGGVVPNGD